MRPKPRLAPLALVAALVACSYSYRNSAEGLGAGEVAGRTVDGATLDGVAITLERSALTATSRAGGRFALLPLPVGRHTLALRHGKDRAARVEVEIGRGKDGQAEGLWIGDVVVPAGVALAGSCTLQGGAALADDGLAVDEITGATARVTSGAVGQFAFEGLAFGLHRIRVFATDGARKHYLGGPIEVEFSPAEAGLQKVLLPLTLRRATEATGRVTLRLAILGPAPELSLGDLTLSGLGAVTIQPDGLAQVDVAEDLWTAAVRLPVSAAATEPPPQKVIVLAGETVDLGTLHVVAKATLDRAERACHADADCAPGTCSGGVCAGFTPPDVAPASIPLCDGSTRGCTAGAPLGAAPPVTMTCMAGTALTVGVACGASCTPDGVEELRSEFDVDGCPTAP